MRFIGRTDQLDRPTSDRLAYRILHASPLEFPTGGHNRN